jgi:hypothetical protein
MGTPYYQGNKENSMADRQHTDDNISKRLSSLIITRSPSSRAEIPEDNLAERDSDESARGQIRVEQGDTGEVDKQG